MPEDCQYYFTNPLDLMSNVYDSLEEAEIAARGYIGTEDSFADEVTEVAIYKRELVKVVKV